MIKISDFLNGIDRQKFHDITKEYGLGMFELFHTVSTTLDDIQNKCGNITIEEAKQYILPAIVNRMLQYEKSKGSLEDEFTKFSNELVLKELNEFLKGIVEK